jgi:thiol-disulfide isomerase/thioredoxin
MLARRSAMARISAALCGLALVTSAGCSTSGPGKDSGGLDVGGITIIPAADRKAAPDLAGDLVGGGHSELSSQQGQIVVLNVWGSWCGPCRAEAPALVEAARTLPQVVFMGIDIRDNESEAEAFISSNHVPYPSFFSQDSSLLLGLQRIVSIPSPPVTIILDKQHRVAASIYGSTTTITVREIVKSLERES